jgi:hypothetical protein
MPISVYIPWSKLGLESALGRMNDKVGDSRVGRFMESPRLNLTQRRDVVAHYPRHGGFLQFCQLFCTKQVIG